MDETLDIPVFILKKTLQVLDYHASVNLAFGHVVFTRRYSWHLSGCTNGTVPEGATDCFWISIELIFWSFLLEPLQQN